MFWQIGEFYGKKIHLYQHMSKRINVILCLLIFKVQYFRIGQLKVTPNKLKQRISSNHYTVCTLCSRCPWLKLPAAIS